MFLDAEKKLTLLGLLMSGITTTAVAQNITLLDQGNFFSTLNNNNPNLNGSFLVTEDITLPPYWTPVGTLDSPASLKFNGSNYVISGLNVVTTAAKTPTGLFGYLVDSWVHSVILDRPAVLSHGSRSETGAIAGRVLRSNITDNLIAGGSVGTRGDIGGSGQDRYAYAGGVTGSASLSRIERNLNNARVHTTGNRCHAGGVTGYQTTNCITSGNLNMGEISTRGRDADAGGVTAVQFTSTTSDNVNTGTVSTRGREADAGGATGRQRSSTTSGNLNMGAVRIGGYNAYAGGVTGRQQSSTTSGNLNTGAVMTGGKNARAGGTTGSQDDGSTTSANLNTGIVSTEGELACAGGTAGFQWGGSTTIGNVNTGPVSTGGVHAYAGGTTGHLTRSTTTGNLNTGSVSTKEFRAHTGGTTGRQWSSTTSGNLNTGAVRAVGLHADAGGTTGYQLETSTTTGNLNTGAVSTLGSGAYAGGVTGNQFSGSTTRGNVYSGSVTTASGPVTNLTGAMQVSGPELRMGLNGLSGTLWTPGDNSQFPMLTGINVTYRDLQRINGTGYGNNSFPVELNGFAGPDGSMDASLFDQAIWNVRDSYLPFLKTVGRDRAESLGLDCDEGGFACDCYPGASVDCPELAPFTNTTIITSPTADCLFTLRSSGTLGHLLYDGQRYHGIVRAASDQAYWAAYEGGEQVALEPCGVYGFADLSPSGSGIAIDAAASDGDNAYVAFHVPELSGQVLIALTLGGQQFVSSSVLGLGRVVSLSIDGNRVLVNTGREVCRLPVDSGQEPECDRGLLNPGEEIRSVAGNSGDLYLLVHQEGAGYRIRTVSEAGYGADFMIKIPSGASQGTITPTLKVIGQHLHLLLADQDLIIWRQYSLAALPEMFDENWESEVTAPMPRDITPAAITLIPETDAGAGLEQVFVLGHLAGQPQYARLMATDFTTTSPDSADQSSGTQASFPSLPLTVAAIIPMLQWRPGAFF